MVARASCPWSWFSRAGAIMGWKPMPLCRARFGVAHAAYGVVDDSGWRLCYTSACGTSQHRYAVPVQRTQAEALAYSEERKRHRFR